MKIADVMTRNPVCCLKGTSLQDVGRLMVEHHCGELPVVDSYTSMHLVGVITDRDIVCRTVAKGIDPLEHCAGDFMTSECVSCRLDDEIEDCYDMMESRQIRRLPIVDEEDCVCGIIAQADLVAVAPSDKLAAILREVSRDAGVGMKQVGFY